MPIFSKISDKVATASYRRSKNWESKGHSRRMHFTLGNTTVKQRVKAFLKKLCRIYTASVDQCNVIS